MHLFDPYGTIRRERERRHNRAVIKFALLWVGFLCALVIVVNLALSLAQ